MINEMTLPGVSLFTNPFDTSAERATFRSCICAIQNELNRHSTESSFEARVDFPKSISLKVLDALSEAYLDPYGVRIEDNQDYWTFVLTSP